MSKNDFIVRTLNFLQEYGLRFCAAAAVLVFVLMFSSPWWIHRALELSFFYTSDSPVRISASTDYDADLFNREKLLFTSSDLSAGKDAGKAVLLIPAVSGSVRGIRLEMASRGEITLSNLTISSKKGVHQVDFSRDLLVPNALYRFSQDKLSVPGKNGGVFLVFPQKLKAGNRFRGRAFIISLISALILSVLFFFRMKFRFCSGKAMLTAVFCLCALGLMLFPVMMLDIHSVVSKENRLFQKFPAWNRGDAVNSEFPREFELYLGDRFYGREKMIRWNGKIFSLNFFEDDRGTAYDKNAFYGKSDWMFSTYFDAVNMALNKNRFTDAELKMCGEHLDRLADEFRTRYDAPVFVVLMPDKERVYPEYYPDFLMKQRQHPESRLEQLAAYLQKHSRVKVIFPLPHLLEKKGKGILYYPTGTHQTLLGGFHSAEMINKALLKEFPQLAALPENSIRWKLRKGADVDIARQMCVAETELPEKLMVHPHPSFQWRYKTQQRQNVPFLNLIVTYSYSQKFVGKGIRLLVMGDSFWGNIMPFMAPLASEQMYIFYGNGRNFAFAPCAEEIERFKPQAVVIESTERFLQRFLSIQ